MKKFVIFIIAILGMQSLIAQDRYTVTLNLSLRTKTNHMECNTYVDVTLYLDDNTSINRRFTVPIEVNDGRTYTFPPETIGTGRYVTSIKCEGHHRDNPDGLQNCHEIGSGTNTVNVSLSEYPCISNKAVTSFMGRYDDGCILRVNITPIPTTISYIANGVPMPNGAPSLPDAKIIGLSAPSGYVSSVYQWKYCTVDSLNNASDSLNNASSWTDFPSSIQGVNTENVKFTGNDLFSNFREMVFDKKNVQVRLDWGCGQSNTVTLTTLLIAPEMVDATGINTTCGRDDNGQIKIKYSRPLYDGEYLNFELDTLGSLDKYQIRIGWNDANIIKDNDNQEVTIKDLNIGKYKVRLFSYWNEDRNVLYSTESDDFSRQNVIISKGGEELKVINSITTDVRCKGSADGTFSLSATGGSGNYHIELHKEMENDIFKQSEPFTIGETGMITGLPAGSYDAYIIDASGCVSNSIPVDIFEPYNPFVIETVNTVEATFNENYEEENNGSIQISVSNEEPPFTYIWKEGDENGTILLSQEDKNSFTSMLENINSGSYYVNISNANGCSVDSVIVVERSPNISFSIEQTGIIVCSGDNTGQLTATVNGGVPPYTFQWYKIDEYTGTETALGISDLVLSDITAGLYQLWVTDDKGSRAKSQVFTQTEENPIIVSFQTEILNCNDDADGFLEANISGGTPPYIFTWYNGSTNARIEGLKAGLYDIHVVDAAGCIKDAKGAVEGPAPINIEGTITYPSCYGIDNGRIKLSVSGGNAPYTYKWSNGSEQSEITDLGIGTYSVTVADSKNCEVVQKSFTIDKPEQLIAELRNYTPISRNNANDGSFSVSVKGGTPPYSISCIRDGQENITAFVTNLQNDGSYLFTYTNLGQGSYEITIHDKNFNSNPDYQACSTTLSVNLPNPPPLEASINEIQSIACFDGEGTLEAIGSGGDIPYAYNWFSVVDNNRIPLSIYTATISGIKSGIYIVEIADNSGYSVFSPEFYLGQPEALGLNFNVKNNTCYGGNDGQISVNVHGGIAPYNYSWDSGDATAAISGKQNGQYSVIVTDRNGCKVSGETSISSPESFHVEYETTSMSCYGLDDASIKLKVSGGMAPYSYSWNNNTQDSILSHIGAGSYKVSISDANNCVFDTTFVIADLLPIQANLYEMKTPVGYGYFDGSFKVEITGGNPPYNAYWTNEQGVVMDSSFIENDNDRIFATLKGVSEGNYYLIVEDSNYQKVKQLGLESGGCTSTFEFYMPQPPKLEVSISEIKSITCFGSVDGAITSSVTGGIPFNTGLPYTYEWILNDESYQNNTDQITGLKSGTYRLKVTDSNGIEALSEPLYLGQPDALTLQFQAADIKCSRDVTGWAEVSVSGGTSPYTYEWSTGDTSPRIENIPKGKYMCWVKDANGCEATGIASVVQANAIIVQNEMIEPTCRGGNDGKIIINLSGGEPPYSYEWENGEKTLTRTGLAKGNYTFTVTDAYGCGYEVETYQLGEPEEITVDLGGDRELCIGQDVTVEATIPEPAQSFTWYDQTGKELFTGKNYTLSQAGTYTVKAITSKGCTAYGSIAITRDDRRIAADFLLASKVPINDDVYAINVSMPEPDRVEWILPENGSFEVIDENDQLLAIIFHEYGDYIIGMKSFSGKCWEVTFKSVRVMDKIDIDNYEDADEPMLRSFTVMPNPALDHFTAVIELKEEAPVELFLINAGTGVIMQRKHLEGNAIYTETFNLLPTQKGTYILRLSAPKANSALKVILK